MGTRRPGPRLASQRNAQCRAKSSAAGFEPARPSRTRSPNSSTRCRRAKKPLRRFMAADCRLKGDPMPLSRVPRLSGHPTNWKRCWRDLVLARVRSLSVASSQEPPTALDETVGLCSRCRFATTQPSAKGSAFWRCRRADSDSTFRRYPPLPIRTCLGFEPGEPEGRIRKDS